MPSARSLSVSGPFLPASRVTSTQPPGLAGRAEAAAEAQQARLRCDSRAQQGGWDDSRVAIGEHYTACEFAISPFARACVREKETADRARRGVVALLLMRGAIIPEQ